MEIDFARLRYLINREPGARFRVERAMSRATRCTTMITGMPGGHKPGSQVERGAEDLALAKTALQRIRDEIKIRRADLAPYIPQLTSALQRVAMRMRYMEGHRVREISCALSYSEQHVYRILEAAEAEILAKYENHVST